MCLIESTRDVLQRHLTLHQDNSSARPRACDACHANKTRCDGNGVSNCSFCNDRSIGRLRAHHLWRMQEQRVIEMPYRPLFRVLKQILSLVYQPVQSIWKQSSMNYLRHLLGQLPCNTMNFLVLKQEQVLARANSLCGWFIETLKVTGFLNRSHAQQVLQTEFPGSYGPWVSMLTDEWKRLVCNLYKVETRLSLDCQQRPRLSDVELEAVLPSSFSLRNCYGMDVFLYRQQYESASRDIKLSSMIKHPEHFLPDPLLVEDIQLGLCGLIIEVFEHGNTRPFMNTPLNAATDSIIDSILKRLAIWNTHIEYVTQKLSSDGLDATHDSLLINYFAWEDETQGLLNGRTEYVTGFSLCYLYYSEPISTYLQSQSS
ncbi:Uncharacterized protein HZ326_25098 [Fusarium oxysporum f. sp. albedinis]|nr:Uncharacterized protein HZ326_25098 [Fusarium oxysporum f. sp. albedinis]